MVFRHCVQFDAKDFPSLSMVQHLFRERYLPNSFLRKKPKEIEWVKKSPVVWIFNDENIEKDIVDFKTMVGNGNFSELADMDPNYFQKMDNGPFAIVVCLNPDGVHGNCRLSNEDKEILRQTKDILVNRHNVVYLVKGKRHHKRYDTEDLMSLSIAIPSFTNTEENSKNIFRKLFFMEEEQAIFRTGLCFLDSVVHYLKTILDEYSKFYRQISIIENEINETGKENKEAKNYTCKSVDEIAQEKLKRNRCRSQRSKPIERKPLIACEEKTEQSQNVRIITEDWINKIRNEISTIEETVFLHEFKTVALRHGKVNGFGCRQDFMCVSLKADNEKDKEEVHNFLLNNFNNKNGKINGRYDLIVQFRERKINRFSNLQQGSKIQTSKTSPENKGFGSVGMFLHDENGSYFFTTCAHVIGEDANAFSPDDRSRIGVNIFVFNSGQNEPDGFMDFSVVRISPEKNILCSFGLRSITGNFTEFQVFRGDILEVRNRKMYIWGAADLNKRFGNCIECSEEKGLISFRVDSENFARPGDSGSIICVGTDEETSYAAFVFVGERADNGKGEYAGYKVSNAIKIMKSDSKLREIKLVILPNINVPIASSPFPTEEVTPKRKKRDSSKSPPHKKLYCSKHNCLECFCFNYEY